MEQSVYWVLGGYGAVLLLIGGVAFRQTSQIAVLQKTVDLLVVKMDLFLKTETDSFKDIVNQNTQALKDMKR